MRGAARKSGTAARSVCYITRMKRLLIGVILAVGLVLPVRADFEAGVEAYKRGNYAAALREFKPLAKQGHAEAEFRLGVMYENGIGVPRDYVQAVKWYRRAAGQGHARAMDRLGFMYAAGKGVPKDHAEAIKWYRLAAGQEVAKVERRPGVLQAEERVMPRGVGERILPTVGRKCPGSPDTPYEVNVRMEFPPAPINHDVSIAELTQGSVHGPRWRTVGKTALNFEIETSAEYFAVPFGDQFCFWVRRIPVTLRYRSVDIYVAREYSTGRCQYRVILDHEKDHIRTARRNLIRYVAKVKAALTSLLIPTGGDPVVVASPEQAEREVEALVPELLKPAYESMLADLRKAQASIDSPEEYRRTFRRCRNW